MRPRNPLQGSFQIYSILASLKGPEADSGHANTANKPRAP